MGLLGMDTYGVYTAVIAGLCYCVLTTSVGDTHGVTTSDCWDSWVPVLSLSYFFRLRVVNSYVMSLSCVIARSRSS